MLLIPCPFIGQVTLSPTRAMPRPLIRCVVDAEMTLPPCEVESPMRTIGSAMLILQVVVALTTRDYLAWLRSDSYQVKVCLQSKSFLCAERQMTYCNLGKLITFLFYIGKTCIFYMAASTFPHGSDIDTFDRRSVTNGSRQLN